MFTSPFLSISRLLVHVDPRLHRRMKVPIEKNCPSFSIGSFFFNLVVDAFKSLRNQLTIVLSIGDMSAELLRIQTSMRYDHAGRLLPNQFVRGWLSNVP